MIPHSIGLPHRGRVAATGAVCRRPTCRPGLLLLVATLVVLVLPGTAAAQFTEWAAFSVSDPFSVTAAVRGLNPTLEPVEGPVPQVRLEALVGYFGGAQNQFDYQSSTALPAPELDSTAIRVVDTRSPISFTTSGVQNSLNGLCCSNNAIGLDDDRSIHAFTDFATGESWEVIIGTPEEGGLPVRVRRLSLPRAESKEKP